MRFLVSEVYAYPNHYVLYIMHIYIIYYTYIYYAYILGIAHTSYLKLRDVQCTAGKTLV